MTTRKYKTSTASTSFRKTRSKKGGVKKISKEEEEEEVCPICIEELKKSDNIPKLPCKHKFHKHCLVPVCNGKNNRNVQCPICRGDITNSCISDINPLSPLRRRLRILDSPSNEPMNMSNEERRLMNMTMEERRQAHSEYTRLRRNWLARRRRAIERETPQQRAQRTRREEREERQEREARNRYYYGDSQEHRDEISRNILLRGLPLPESPPRIPHYAPGTPPYSPGTSPVYAPGSPNYPPPSPEGPPYSHGGKGKTRSKRQRGENQKEKDKYLFDAIGIYDYDKVEDALNNGANVNARNKDGDTPLICAGDTPLICAIKLKDIDIVYLLLYRPDIDIKLDVDTNKELQLAENLEEDDQDQSGIPYAIEHYIVTKIEKKRIQNIVAQIIPKHLERQKDRTKLAWALREKDVGNIGDGTMPYELRYEIGKYLGGGKRKIRKKNSGGRKTRKAKRGRKLL